MAATRRRPRHDAAARSNSPQADKARQRLNVRIDSLAYQRLMIHCVMTGKQPGEFLTSLIETHCRDWKVQVNTVGSVISDDRLEAAACVNEIASAAA
jgi:hypothetical protein